MNAFVSTFTPSLMTRETLEAILVEREDLADRLVGLIRDSATSGNKHHALLIGPRGIGKTHMVCLVYHRLRAQGDLADRLLIAWLREEEWGVSTFRDVAMRILRALAEVYDDADLAGRLDSLYEQEPDAAERMAAELLRDYVADKTLLVLTENLDDMFAALGDEGQKRLRAYVQQEGFFTILATAQSLFAGVQRQESPFYGFFEPHHLQELTLEGVTGLLGKIATLTGDAPLASLLETPVGRARIRAVHHLGGGNHRVYVIFSQFLTRETLDELVEAVMQMIEKLTPYYQSRMARLSPQQRKIVEYLCEHGGATPVKGIAQRCFATSQAISGTLKDLREMGYVRAHSRGRESHYELREPLMRICIEVKKQRGRPIRLLVDFLRLWYTREELQGRAMALGSDRALERDYLVAALRECDEADKDPVWAACEADYDKLFASGDAEGALNAAEEMLAVRADAKAWAYHGTAMGMLQRHGEALTSFDKALEIDPKHANAWTNRGVVLGRLGREEEELASYDKALEIDPKYANAWTNRGVALGRLGRQEEELASYDKALEIDPKDAGAWYNRAVTLGRLGRYEESLTSCDKALEIDPKNANTWYNRGVVLERLGREQEALASYDKALEIDPKDAGTWYNRGVVLGRLGREEKALASYDKALEIDPRKANAWTNRGAALGRLGREEEALASCDKALEIDPKDAKAWTNRGVVLGRLGRDQEALASCDKALEIDPKNANTWYNRGVALERLGREEEALASYDKALEIDPKYANAWYNRGMVLGRLGREEEALASYDKALGIDPKTTAVYVVRGLGRMLRSPEVSVDRLAAWVRKWEQLAGDREELRMFVRLAGAAVRYRAEPDERILLELPAEERTIVRQMLGIEEENERAGS